jgi:hypothetical protein
MERLVHALLPENEAQGILRGFYTDAFHATLMKRLAGLRVETDPDFDGRKTTRLQTWRLQHVYEHVEKNLSNRLALADLAQVTGLSRMHFAAQVRAATRHAPARLCHPTAHPARQGDAIRYRQVNCGYCDQHPDACGTFQALGTKQRLGRGKGLRAIAERLDKAFQGKAHGFVIIDNCNQ